MNTKQIQAALQQGPYELKALCRLYLFASLSQEQHASLPDLAAAIQQSCGCSREELHAGIQRQYAKWSEKIARADTLLINSEWMEGFLAQNRSLFHGKYLSSSEACSLSTSLLCMVLQHVSILSGRNHMKRRDVRHLLELLEHECHQKQIQDYLFRPILQAAKGRYSVNSEAFIQRTYALVQNLAYFYLADLEGHEAKKQIILQTIFQIHTWPLETVNLFLNASSLEPSHQP